MIDHAELSKEIEYITQLPDRERIIMAKKRRQKQLESYNKYIKRESISKKCNDKNRPRRLRFKSEIELLDAAATRSYDDVLVLIKSGMLTFNKIIFISKYLKAH